MFIQKGDSGGLGVNGIGLMGLAVFALGFTMFTLGIHRNDLILILASLPFSAVGVVALFDDLLYNEKITKRLLGLEEKKK